MLPKELSQVTIFTTAQLRLRGVEQEDLRRAVSDGTLKRLKRGWYTHRSPTLPAEWHRLRTLAELKDHPGTVASHHSGAAVLRLPVHRPDWNRVHLMRTDDGPAQSRAGVIIHQRIGDCTAPDAALVAAQTALICPVSGLMALDHALRNDLATLADFDRWCTQLGKHAGRGHLRLVRRLADRRRESPLESRTAYVFDCWGRPIEPQFEVPGTNYRADGRIRGTRVLVECDGLGKYDEEGASWPRKSAKTRFAHSSGRLSGSPPICWMNGRRWRSGCGTPSSAPSGWAADGSSPPAHPPRHCLRRERTLAEPTPPLPCWGVVSAAAVLINADYWRDA